MTAAAFLTYCTTVDGYSFFEDVCDIWLSHSHIIHMRKAVFELFVSIHRLFWTASWVPGHLTTFKRAPWLHAANSHTAAGTSHLLPYQSPCLGRCFSASSKGSRSGPVQLFFMVHSSQIAVFNFYEPVHDRKHTFIGGVGPIFQFVTIFWKPQQQSCFTIWAARTISCLMCGRELSY